MMKTMLAAVAAVVAAPALMAAPADNPLAKDAVVLDLRNLDLATVDGQHRLAIRMDAAVRAVCGDRVATIHLDLEAQSRACRTEVLANIRSRIEARTASVARQGAVAVASAPVTMPAATAKGA